MLTLNGTTTLEVSMEGSKLGSGVLLRVKPSKGIVKSKRLSNSDRWVKRVNTFGLKSTGLLHSFNNDGRNEMCVVRKIRIVQEISEKVGKFLFAF